MRYLTPLISDARGKLGNTVFSRNPYGLYTRAKTAPIQPRTTTQQLNRAYFATFSAAWRALTPAERTAWEAYAATLTLSNSLGTRYHPTGYHTFLTASLNNKNANSPFAPTPAGHLEPNQFQIAFLQPFVHTGTGVFKLLVGSAPEWPGLAGGCVPQFTAGLSPSIKFVPRQTYRNISNGWSIDPVFELFNPTFQYLSVFPQPAVGTVIHMKLRANLSQHGLLGAEIYNSAIVQAVP